MGGQDLTLNFPCIKNANRGGFRKHIQEKIINFLMISFIEILRAKLLQLGTHIEGYIKREVTLNC